MLRGPTRQFCLTRLPAAAAWPRGPSRYWPHRSVRDKGLRVARASAGCYFGPAAGVGGAEAPSARQHDSRRRCRSKGGGGPNSKVRRAFLLPPPRFSTALQRGSPPVERASIQIQVTSLAPPPAATAPLSILLLLLPRGGESVGWFPVLLVRDAPARLDGVQSGSSFSGTDTPTCIRI